MAADRRLVLISNAVFTVRSITSYVEVKFRRGGVSVMFITGLLVCRAGVPSLKLGKKLERGAFEDGNPGDPMRGRNCGWRRRPEQNRRAKRP
jgi:hypothetical protein